MFTPEQRAAAAAVAYVPTDPPVVVPPGPPAGGSSGSSGPVYVGLSTADLMRSTGLDPNTADIGVLFEQGWTFADGQWFKRGGASTSGGAGSAAGGAPRPSAASYTSAAVYGGGSVLGYTVPIAPPVLLPLWVGGRVGKVREPGGYRPESGGTPIVRGFGKREPWMRVEAL